MSCESSVSGRKDMVSVSAVKAFSSSRGKVNLGRERRQRRDVKASNEGKEGEGMGRERQQRKDISESK